MSDQPDNPQSRDAATPDSPAARAPDRAPAPAPDWDGVAEEVHCPLCEYNLRGLIEPRCPECGYRFDWPELLDPTKRLHPYLFEHHPERKFRAFRQTLVGGLRPRRFWRSLLPIQPTFPRRLLAYWLAAAVAYLVLAAASFVPAAVWEAKHISTLRPIAAAALNNPANGQYKQRIIDEYGSVQAYLDLMYPTHLLPSLVLQRLVAPEFVMPSLVLLAWPWMTFATLMIFRISMRRARVRTIHVLRCVLYTYDLAVWIGLACLVAMTVRYALTSTCNPDDWIDTILLVIEAGLILAFYRLWMAYRLHLRFDHAFATVLASQVITVLLWAILFGVIPSLIF